MWLSKVLKGLFVMENVNIWRIGHLVQKIEGEKKVKILSSMAGKSEYESELHADQGSESTVKHKYIFR